MHLSPALKGHSSPAYSNVITKQQRTGEKKKKTKEKKFWKEALTNDVCQRL